MALTVTAASVIPSSAAVWKYATAAGTITRGQPVYLATDGTALAANGNSSGSVTAATVAGLSMSDVGTGQRCYYISEDPALTHGITTSEIAPGNTVYLDDTAGGMTVTYSDLDAADWVCQLGQINNPETTMNFKPLAPVLKAAT